MRPDAFSLLEGAQWCVVVSWDWRRLGFMGVAFLCRCRWSTVCIGLWFWFRRCPQRRVVFCLLFDTIHLLRFQRMVCDVRIRCHLIVSRGHPPCLHELVPVVAASCSAGQSSALCSALSCLQGHLGRLLADSAFSADNDGSERRNAPDPLHSDCAMIAMDVRQPRATCRLPASISGEMTDAQAENAYVFFEGQEYPVPATPCARRGVFREVFYEQPVLVLCELLSGPGTRQTGSSDVGTTHILRQARFSHGPPSNAFNVPHDDHDPSTHPRPHHEQAGVACINRRAPKRRSLRV